MSTTAVRSFGALNGTVRLHAVDSGGNPAQVPILFVPGLTDVAEDYLPVLSSFGRRTIVVDLRGRGRSDTPPSGYATADHVGDIEAVLGAVIDGPVHLVTFSRGTVYGLSWAFAHPERVRSAAIGDYPARELAPDPSVATFLATGRWRGTPVTSRISTWALDEIFRAAVDRSLWSELAALDVPVLAVRCGGQGPVDDEDWERYATDLGDVERVVFEDSPHDIFRPDRHRFPGLVRDHVDRAERIATSAG